MVLANKHRGRELDPVPKHEDLVKGQVTLDDDSEVTIFDVGQLSSQTVEIIESAYFDIVVNDQTNIDLRLKVDVNGSLVAIGGTKAVTTDSTFDLENFDAADKAASSRVVVTAQGDQAAPATGATIDYTVEHLTAT